ncbi:uncharacterized protein LOC113359090 [Papaver somniferum]|uniref:uncharacterized protein LOC113359090 n=1 Tax=Papaver somniferum TaxID=3469 RepID=UPI000E6FE365|nr:uncharacterized protein LOC113359090 [Papaver somniferum]
MLWHDRAQVSSEYVDHPIDSSQWEKMKLKFLLFAAEGRNVWLGISTNGFNPHGVRTLSWSCWPVILVVYNLPPSICMKFEFQMMTLLIPGRKLQGQDIDVVLRPLVKTLKKLWHQGVQAFDSLKNEYFTLKATLMFRIHDFPAQDETRSTHLGYDSKIVYTNYRIFLKSRHPFRDGTYLGLETHEHKSALLRLTGAQSLEKLADVHYEPGKLVVRKTGKRKRYQSDKEEYDSELVTGEKDLRTALQQVSLYFRILCSKVVRRECLNQAKCMIAEAMCVLEKYFPAGFLDISVHNMVHSDDEALVCGPVRYRWMYPFERGMKECKSIPNNNRYIEGSITKSIEMDDYVRFSMEHMKNADKGGHKVNLDPFLKDEREFNDMGSLLDENPVQVSHIQWMQIRRSVIFRNDPEGLDVYYRDNCENCESDGVAMEEVEMQTKFLSWLYEKMRNKMDTDLWRYVRGPASQKEYKRYRVNGFSFFSQENQEKAKTQDSGVTVVSSTTFRSSKRDKSLVTNLTRWYGVIRQILENGTKICQDSDFPSVNLSILKIHTKISDEPVILDEETAQVFYSRDVKHPDWWVVIHTPRGLTADVDKAEIPGHDSFQDILQEEPHLCKLLEQKRLPRTKK